MSTAWNTRREQWLAAWRALAPRERSGLGLAALALALLLLVLVFINPALRTLREAPARLDQLDAQLAQMQAWAAEAQQLQAQPPVNPAQALAALRAASEFLGPEASLNLQGDRATLHFNKLGGEALGAWLAEARRAARARPLEAQLQRGPDGYGGSIVLQLNSAAP